MVREEGLEEPAPPISGPSPGSGTRTSTAIPRRFIGGSVEADAGGKVDCIEGARVTLHSNGTQLAETATDIYGDFKFDHLDPDSGAYRVEIAADGHASKSVDVTLGESTYLGEIRL